MSMYVMESAPGARAVINGRQVDYFCGCGYFGFQGHPELIEASCHATRQYGLGTGTSRLGYGNNQLLMSVEKNAAKFFDTEDALYYSSGYMGNSILLQGLSNDYDIIFADEEFHYSIKDGASIAGKRSHFGRVYVDAMVWCRQAGGDEDTLGWEYRAKVRVEGNNPGIRENHRTRWFEFYPEEEVNAAYNWFLGYTKILPTPDLLECALLRWKEATLDDRLKMVRALAASGRNVCLRRAAGLPEGENLRQTCLQELCDSPELAETVLEKSHHLYNFRSWFRNNEANLVRAPNGRFRLTRKAANKEVPFTTTSSSEIWDDFAEELINQLDVSLNVSSVKAVVVMPAGHRDNRRQGGYLRHGQSSL